MATAVKPADSATDEVIVRCRRCASFIIALLRLAGPQPIRGYCKRCGCKWEAVIRPPREDRRA